MSDPTGAPPDTAEVLHGLVAALDSPMFVVTAAAGAQRDGCLVGFVTQCSIDPVRFLVLLSKANRTFRIAQRATVLGLHFLGETDSELAAHFGETTADRSDKLEGWDWEAGPEGVPLLAGTRGWAVGRILARLDAGDHVAHLLEPTGARRGSDDRPLGFQAVRGLSPGHPA